MKKNCMNLKKKIAALNSTAPVFKSSYSKVSLTQVLDIKAFSFENAVKKDAGFLEFRPYRMHEAGVASLLFKAKGVISRSIFENWLSNLLNKYQVDIFRVKGVFKFQGDDNLKVLQGVYSSFELSPYSPKEEALGKSQNKLNIIVFIGRNLPVLQIIESWQVAFKETSTLSLDRPSALASSIVPLLSIVALFAALFFDWGNILPEFVYEHSNIFLCILCVVAIYVRRKL